MGQTVSANEERFRRETDALTIQAALDEAAVSGIPVTVPRYNARRDSTEWRIDRALVLHSGSDLILDNALLIQETGTYDHMITNDPGAKEICVAGEGFATLSGGQENRLREGTAGRYGLPDVMKNAMIRIRDAKAVVLANLRIEHQRYHAVVLENVVGAFLRNMDFFAYPSVPNQGGIWLRSGTKGVLIENVTGRTGDDTIRIGYCNEGSEAEDSSFEAENSPSEADNRDGADIDGVSLKNILADPARSSLVRIETNGRRKVRNIRLDTLMDASRFYEKKRSGSVLAFQPEKGGDSSPSDISGVRARNLYSRSDRAVAVNGPFSGTVIQNIMTHGDNIYAAGTKKTEPVALSGVVFDHVYYGPWLGSNNADSFISLQAKNAKAFALSGVSGCEIRSLFDLSEECR